VLLTHRRRIAFRCWTSYLNTSSIQKRYHLVPRSI